MASTKCFKPRRGKYSYMSAAGTVLQKGELFFEVPEDGVGTGECKIKMGDGVSDYSTLPYAIDLDAVKIDPETFEITFDTPSSSTSVSDLLGMIVDGADLSTIIGAVKALLTSVTSDVSSLESQIDSITSDSNSGKVGTSTVGSASRPVWLNAGTITAISGTIGGTARPIYSNDGVLTAISSDVGGSARGIYSSGGTLTACSSTVGSNTQPAFMSSGTITACSTTVGSGTRPIYSNAGVLTAIGTTVGGSTTPIYSSSGTLTACSAMMPLTGSTFTGLAYAQTNTSYTIYQLRNIAFSTSTPSSLTNGNICMVYS